MARSPTARVELSKKSFAELIAALAVLSAFIETLNAAGEKAGFKVADAGDEDEDEDSDDEDSDDEDSGDEDEDSDEDDEDSDDEDEDSDEDDEDSDEDDEDEDEEPAVTGADLKKAKASLQDVLDKVGRKDSIALLTKFKIEKISDLAQSDLKKFVSAAAELVAGAGKGGKGKKKK